MNAQDLRLDYFKIYSIRDVQVDYKVALKGQFDQEPEAAELMLLDYFATVVSKNDEPIYDKNANLTWYCLTTPFPEPQRVVQIENQFGQHEIVIGKARGLLAPAPRRSIDLLRTRLDHFKLYEVLNGKALEQWVAIKDQFGEEKVEIYCPIYFGTPVQKTYNDKNSPIHNEKAHLIIYRITPTQRLIRPILVRDQFRQSYVQFLWDVGLAIPSLKLKWDEI